ncbi:NACHT and WD40 domain protein [Aspergillus luchuensis]|uniref:Uncharacterized protein n=1 Tax=Aspergillus kawachii TaxID=1069201 RepID=A0A7R7WXG6_ASPKA|nr:uncharacterized protein AKAW2_40275S [Aspergillus luchuensis]BCR98592.1 hypothetical protein AKAW2_40275S [Aspergillus luchuensis]BCS10926.1 hypothetical protein ALUC_40266S [Aspergillus luchuensis]GAA92419.1 NACHT and WD40 domain protein [Aspergillus luchuensis IFO 4308]
MVHFKARLRKWLHRDGGSQNTAPPPHQADHCTNHSPASEYASAPCASECQSQSRNPPPSQDLWKSAFDLLSREEQNALRTSLVSSSTTDALNNVIETTKEKYEIYQEKGGIRIRKSTGEEISIRKISKKIINATISFQEVISAGVACDPTGHAASAWAIVSLGLTMAKHDSDRRDALFESSEYLAEALARCAYIEKKLCHNRSDEDDVVTQAMVTLYKTILQYAAKVMASHNMSTRGKLLDSVTAATVQHITELRCSIEKEEQKLFHFTQLQLLEAIEEITVSLQKQNEKATEEILTAIDDKLSKSLNALNLRFSLPIAENAFWNSYQHEDLCLEDTRVQTRSQITQWADSVESECIFWLNGGAGTGKSTIARTVAQSFETKGQLGASFFFKRGEPDRCNAKRLIPTIAKELIKQNKDLASGVLKAIEQDPQIAAKDVTEQFNKLLLEPLKSVAMYQSRTLVIVIDALDECENDKEIEKILQFLPRVHQSSNMRLKIFLTSRPELPLRRFFEKEGSHRRLVLEKVAEEAIREDIVRFLEHRFKEIRAQAKTGEDWPGNDVVEALATVCIPLFISAATICRFVEQKGEDPVKRLADILNNQHRYVTRMDKTYGPILDRTLQERDEDDQEMQIMRFKGIVGVVILLSAPLSISALSEFVGIGARSVEFHLDSFHSVLSIPDEQHLPVRILHLSFREYLLTTQSRFHVDAGMMHNNITSHCFRVMGKYLKRDICKLNSYSTQRADICSETTEQYIPEGLRYSCRYWTFHLTQSKPSIPDVKILSFLEKHFLHWLEVMSLMRVLSETLKMMVTLKESIQNNTNPGLSNFLSDAIQFIHRHAQIASVVPLQLYASCLVFTPTSSLVRRASENYHSPWIYALPQVEMSWGAKRQTLEGHSDLVQAVAFSPDGQTVVSGSYDKTIKLWNAATGELQQTLEGHSDRVSAVAFSPDGQTVLSGSYDNTIKLWNAATGELQQTLEGHLYSGLVSAVAFSPDGQTVVSGSDDNTIELWNAATGELQQILEGHSDWVSAVAFSPDGQTVVSGSEDNTIKLWNAATGELQQTLKGHLYSVSAVAFSPDGQTVVSGSCDNTIKLWNAATGELQQTLEGHSAWVRAVAFHTRGRIDTSPTSDHAASQISLADQWVYLKGEKVLWLPSEYSQFSYCSTKEGALALGYESGRVFVIQLLEPN